MKRVLCCLLTAVLLFSLIPVHGYAAEDGAETVYFDDGSYMTIEVIAKGSRASGSVTGSKPATYYDGDGVAQWKVVLTGSFTYTGSDATCTSSSVDVTIYDSSWYAASKYATKSGNKASASVTMADKPAGVVVSTIPVSLSLECDANGNLS